MGGCEVDIEFLFAPNASGVLEIANAILVEDDALNRQAVEFLWHRGRHPYCCFRRNAFLSMSQTKTKNADK